MVLAQYTIRSKQNYIFQTNRLREVTGASALIAGAFGRLISCVEKLGFRVQRETEPFSLQQVKEAFEAGTLQVAELFQGGGNDTLLMDGEDTFRRINQAFTYELMTQTPGMIPLCACVPVGEAWNYREDYNRLSREVSAQKRVMTPGQPDDALPFAMTDSVTRKPYQPERPTGARPGERFTRERFAKYNAYLEGGLWKENASQLDELLGEDDSMLAIIHADGNNMGRKLRNLLGTRTDYDTCVETLRRFSHDIQAVFVDEGDRAIAREMDRIREEYPAAGKKLMEVRCVISDGDDYTFICNARWALRLVKAYMDGISAHEGYSACAGICLFHRHYPFARAYDLAEQACEQAKKKVHTEEAADQCWVDFHYLHGGVPDDLEETRKAHGTEGLIFRPWRFDSADDPDSIQRLISLCGIMISETGTTRTNLKAIGSAMEAGMGKTQAELERVYYRAPELQNALKELFPNPDRLLQAVYDLSEVHDIWFDGRD